MAKITVVKSFMVQVDRGKAPNKSFANTDGFKGLAGKLSLPTQNVFGFFRIGQNLSIIFVREHSIKGCLSTVNLLVLASLDQQLIKLKI
jgi:hypothetical protein